MINKQTSNRTNRSRAFRAAMFALYFSFACIFPKAFASKNSKDMRICLISDMNGSYGNIELPASVHSGVSRLSSMNCNLVLGAGDLVAGQDLSLTTSHLREMWNEWQRVVGAPFLKQGIPVLSAMGNHDASAARSTGDGFIYQRERSQALEFWRTQAQQSAYANIRWMSTEGFPFNYSFAFGSVGVVVFDGSSASEPNRNRVWLEQQLRVMAEKSTLSTRLVVGHLPLFAVTQGRESVGEILAQSKIIYDLLNSNNVDFYISGHHHAFYSGRPEGWPSSYGTVQLALGAMGGGPRRLLAASAPAAKTTFTVMDINESVETSIVFPLARFLVRNFSALSGEEQSQELLPGWLNSRDGQGNSVVLRRVEL